MAAKILVWPWTRRGCMASELDLAGRADRLSFLSSLARVHSHRRCRRSEANGRFTVGQVANAIRPAVRALRTGLVDFRGHQS